MRISDWSSDVCSSDLRSCQAHAAARRERQGGVVFARLFVAIEFLLRVPPCHRRDAARIPAADSVAARARYRMVVGDPRSAEHTSELQSLMRISYAVFCLNKNTNITTLNNTNQHNS